MRFRLWGGKRNKSGHAIVCGTLKKMSLRNIKMYLNDFKKFNSKENMMKKILLILIIAVLFISCDGGSGGDGDSGQGKIANKDLSVTPNLSNLYKDVEKNLAKDQYESTADYDNRINNYASSLTGYHATVKVDVSYDADTQKLKISTLPRTPLNISEGTQITGTYQTDYYELNIDIGYGSTFVSPIPEVYDYDSPPLIVDGVSYYHSYYKILDMDSETAKKIADGFRVDYTFTFPLETLKKSKFQCVSAWFTNCSNNLYCEIDTYRVYNVIDGKEY